MPGSHGEPSRPRQSLRVGQGTPRAAREGILTSAAASLGLFIFLVATIVGSNKEDNWNQKVLKVGQGILAAASI